MHTTSTLGVIVGRFQVPYLHDGHKALINHALNKYDRVLIILGCSDVRNTRNQPFSITQRQMIVSSTFYQNHGKGRLRFLSIDDHYCDYEWSKRLDTIILNNKQHHEEVTVIGGRDSFLKVYTGQFEEEHFEMPKNIQSESGRMIRAKEAPKDISCESMFVQPFVQGVLWAAYHRHPVVYSTVDVVVYDKKGKRLLFCKKHKGDLYRLIGGFVDVEDDNLEDAVKRELYEETGLYINTVQNTYTYLGNFKVNDSRYKNEVDKVITHLYLVEWDEKEPIADDDIESVHWVHLDDLLETYRNDHFITCHNQMIVKLLTHFKIWKVSDEE